jgi:hypothetical protein
LLFFFALCSMRAGVRDDGGGADGLVCVAVERASRRRRTERAPTVERICWRRRRRPAPASAANSRAGLTRAPSTRKKKHAIRQAHIL